MMFILMLKSVSDITKHQHRSSLIIFALMLSLGYSSVNAASFTTRNIGQDNPLASGTNQITITLRPNANLLANDQSVVTIFGLANAQIAPTLDLKGSASQRFSNRHGGPAEKGQFSFGVVTLHVLLDLQKEQDYIVSFSVRNSAYPQPAQIVKIEASGTNQFDTADMTHPNQPALGVKNGQNPMFIVLPNFIKKDIVQRTPRATNLITVNISADCDLTKTSTVAITNLLGSTTVKGDVNVNTCGSQTAGKFDPNTMQLTWTLAETVLAKTACIVTFNLRNPDRDQPSPSVTVEVALFKELDIDLGYIVRTRMTKPGGNKYGITNGEHPLRSVVTTFTKKSIGQSTPVSGKKNTITVTLQTNIDMEKGTTVTISELTGSTTATASTLAVTTCGDKV
jgi:hypothetical protein